MILPSGMAAVRCMLHMLGSRAQSQPRFDVPTPNGMLALIWLSSIGLSVWAWAIMRAEKDMRGNKQYCVL